MTTIRTQVLAIGGGATGAGVAWDAGVGATHHSGATIDGLGYAPERVERPGEALGALQKARPGHPYASVGVEGVTGGLDWFKSCVQASGLAPYAYLMMLHDRGELRTDFRPLPLTVTYHAPCQQQGQGAGKPALDLMALVPELRVVENDATCCGWPVRMGSWKRSTTSRCGSARRCSARSRPPSPTSSCATRRRARWHIEQATGVRTVHPIEILHRAAGLTLEDSR
jgi:hypothetical protein